MKTDGGKMAALKIESELKTNLISRQTLWARDSDSNETHRERERDF